MLRHLDQLQSQHTSTFRVGITGPPGDLLVMAPAMITHPNMVLRSARLPFFPAGAGKSCLMETLGLQLLQAGHRVAVLAVDPSSEASGGAILGDKLRMPRCAAGKRHACPSPCHASAMERV